MTDLRVIDDARSEVTGRSMFAGEDASSLSETSGSTSMTVVSTRKNDEFDYELHEWGRSRVQNIGRMSANLTVVTDPAYDPLAYVVAKYANMPPARDSQCPISVLRNQFMLDYKKMCRHIKGKLNVYNVLCDSKRGSVPDTCKLLAADLALFFASTSTTMSMCMLPSVIQHAALFTADFFQQADWRDVVREKVRQIPNAAQVAPLQSLLDADPVCKSKPFVHPLMEAHKSKIKQQIINAKEALRVALDVCYPHDDKRQSIMREVERRLVRASSLISNLSGIGLDGLGGYEHVTEERKNNESWATMQAMGVYSAKIRRHFGIKILYDPYD